MTFKHSKFIDSVTMRSFEKIAMEKGLITADSLYKKASKKLDLRASDNIMQNVFTLCAGLKQIGLEAYAHDLQKKFLNYKQSSSESGEDLIEQAHPKGGHEVADVEGDALVETILEQHLKMITMVNKKPTGKVSSASTSRDIINAVKYSLGQAIAPTVDALKTSLKLMLETVIRELRAIESKSNDNLTFNITIESYIGYARNPTLKKLRTFKQKFSTLKYQLEKRLDEDVWIVVERYFDHINPIVDKALDLAIKIVNLEADNVSKTLENPANPTNTANPDSVPEISLEHKNKLHMGEIMLKDVGYFRSILANEIVELDAYMSYSGKTAQGLQKANSFIDWLTGIVSNYNVAIRNMQNEEGNMIQAFAAARLFAGVQDPDGYYTIKSRINMGISNYKVSWGNK